MSSIEQLVREDLRDIKPYCPPQRDEGANSIWLDANESPWDSNVAISEDAINRYPDDPSDETIKHMACYYRVDSDQMRLSRGSDDAIDLLIRLTCNAGKDAVITCPPTFCMYESFARIQGADVIAIPLVRERDFAVDFDAIVKAATPNVKLVFLCSPNNPSGGLVDLDVIRNLCQKLEGRSIIVVDEAYIEFSETNSASQLLGNFDNLVVLRTLSKAFGLAGARIGVTLGNAELIKQLQRVCPPYALPSFTTSLLQNAFSKASLATVESQIQIIRSQRKQLINALQTMTWIENIWPSEANFILVEVKDTDRLTRCLSERRIYVKRIDDSALPKNAIRISVGKPEEVRRLIEALREYP